MLLAREKEMVEAALAQNQGRISGPAGAVPKLGIPDSTLEAKIRRMGIDKYRFKSSGADAFATNKQLILLTRRS